MTTEQHSEEIEIKIRIKENKLENIKKKLNELSGDECPQIFQRTFNLDTPAQDLAKRGVFLRTRQESNSATITVKVKQKASNAQSLYFCRKELEVEVSDARIAADMLEILGFSRQRILEKYRQIWKFNKIKTDVSIDILPFGNFIEIEGPKQGIEKMVDSLGLREEPRITVSYWHLFDDFNKQQGTNRDDAIFCKD